MTENTPLKKQEMRAFLTYANKYVSKTYCCSHTSFMFPEREWRCGGISFGKWKTGQLWVWMSKLSRDQFREMGFPEIQCPGVCVLNPPQSPTALFPNLEGRPTELRLSWVVSVTSVNDSAECAKLRVEKPNCLPLRPSQGHPELPLPRELEADTHLGEGWDREHLQFWHAGFQPSHANSERKSVLWWEPQTEGSLLCILHCSVGSWAHSGCPPDPQPLP